MCLLIGWCLECFVRLGCLGGVFGVGLVGLVYCGATFEEAQNNIPAFKGSKNSLFCFALRPPDTVQSGINERLNHKTTV